MPQDRATDAIDWNREWVDAGRRGTIPQLVRRLRTQSSRDAEAAAFLAMIYRDGVTCGTKVLLRRNMRTALAHARRAASLGSRWGLQEVANHLSESPKAKDLREAMRIYRRLSRMGDCISMHNLAVLHQRQGKFSDAARWFRKALLLGDTDAQIELARARFHGSGVRRDPVAAVEELLELASSESTDVSQFAREQCLVFVARAYLEGWGVPRDLPKAMGLLHRAVHIGSNEAKGLLRDLA